MSGLIEFTLKSNSKQLIAVVYSRLLIIGTVFDQPLNEWNVAIPPDFSTFDISRSSGFFQSYINWAPIRFSLLVRPFPLLSSGAIVAAAGGCDGNRIIGKEFRWRPPGNTGSLQARFAWSLKFIVHYRRETVESFILTAMPFRWNI